MTNIQHLALAILAQAMEDASNEKYKPDIDSFIKSSWFDTLVESLDKEPDYLRGRIATQDFSLEGIHAVYRSKDTKRKERYSRQAQTLLSIE